MNGPSQVQAAESRARTGLLYGLFAYGLWGVLPIYFKQLTGVSAIDIVAHRIVWSLFFLGLLLTLTGGWTEARAAVRHRRTLLLLLATSVLIALNWLIYVYAVTSGHILAGSLGYYLNPLMNIVLGRFILKERLTRTQWLAVAIAAAGVSVLAAGAGTTLWISLTLCVSFATYGLLRKIVAVESIAGLAIETTILCPLAVAWLAWGAAQGLPSFGATSTEALLLVAAGVISSTPLLLFTAAARRLRYSTLGMLQFLLAVAIYGEDVTGAHAIAFAAIWTALLLYVISLLHERRAQRLADEAPELSES